MFSDKAIIVQKSVSVNFLGGIEFYGEKGLYFGALSKSCVKVGYMVAKIQLIKDLSKPRPCALSSMAVSIKWSNTMNASSAI